MHVNDIRSNNYQLQMKTLLNSIAALFLLFPLCVMAQNSTPTFETTYPLASAIQCKQMLKSILGENLKVIFVKFPQIEETACVCVDSKMRSDPIISIAFGSDREAQKAMMGRVNLREYIAAKGISFSFSCVAPELSKAADEIVR